MLPRVFAVLANPHATPRRSSAGHVDVTSSAGQNLNSTTCECTSQHHCHVQLCERGDLFFYASRSLTSLPASILARACHSLSLSSGLMTANEEQVCPSLAGAADVPAPHSAAKVTHPLSFLLLMRQKLELLLDMLLSLSLFFLLLSTEHQIVSISPQYHRVTLSLILSILNKQIKKKTEK